MENPPHLFATANHAYHAMLHERKSQRLVLSGESGSGKTTGAGAILRMLVYLGRAPYRNVEDKILQIDPIMEAFGHAAATTINRNSSRYARVTELVRLK